MRTVLVLAVLLPLAAAHAGCPVPDDAGPALASRGDAERLGFLRRTLKDESSAVKTWALAWGSVYGLATIAQLGLAAAVSNEDRPDWAWGAVSTAVGVGFTVFGTPEVMADGDAFALKVGPPGPQDCALIAEGERLFRKDAAGELDGVQWYWHVANVVFNAGMGLILGLGYGHWVSALVNFLVGAAIGEGTLLTQPTALGPAWDRYLGGSLGARAPGGPFQPRLVLAGLSIGFAF